MRILLGYICLMICVIGLIMLAHPRMVFDVTRMFVIGALFGILAGAAHLLLLQ